MMIAIQQTRISLKNKFRNMKITELLQVKVCFINYIKVLD